MALGIFGMASSTRTHTYYLDQVAPPLAAMLGVVLVDSFRLYRRRGRMAWTFPLLLLAGGFYQVHAFRGTMPGWFLLATAMAMAAGAGWLALAFLRRATAGAPTRLAAVVSGAILLLLPLAASASPSGVTLRDLPPGRPPAPPPGAASPYQWPIPKPPGPLAPPGVRPKPKPPPPPGGKTGRPNRPPFRPILVEAVARRLEAMGEKDTAVATVTANQAAPFILRGVPAVAIGGFSGRDPIFTVESFESMASRIGLRYFILRPGAAIAGDHPQSRILTRVVLTWEDVSPSFGAPAGMIYRRP